MAALIDERSVEGPHQVNTLALALIALEGGAHLGCRDAAARGQEPRLGDALPEPVRHRLHDGRLRGPPVVHPVRAAGSGRRPSRHGAALGDARHHAEPVGDAGHPRRDAAPGPVTTSTLSLRHDLRHRRRRAPRDGDGVRAADARPRRDVLAHGPRATSVTTCSDPSRSGRRSGSSSPPTRASCGTQLLVVFLALGFGMSALVGYLRFDSLLAFMVAGFVVQNLSRQGEAFIHALEETGSIVYVVFFATAGADLDVPLLGRLWPMALALAVTRAWSRSVRATWRARFAQDPAPSGSGAGPGSSRRRAWRSAWRLDRANVSTARERLPRARDRHGGAERDGGPGALQGGPRPRGRELGEPTAGAPAPGPCVNPTARDPVASAQARRATRAIRRGRRRSAPRPWRPSPRDGTGRSRRRSGSAPPAEARRAA